MIRLILLALAIFLIWVARTNLKSTISKIKTRLSEGDQIPEHVDGAAITKLLEAATWVRGRQSFSNTGEHMGIIRSFIVCKNAVYTVAVDNNTHKLIVIVKPGTSKGSDSEPFFLNEIIPLYEADRLRKYILAQVCDISDDFRAYESGMDVLLLLAYGAISIITFLIGYTVIPAAISAIFDEIDPESVRSLWNVVAFILLICFGFAIPEYFMGTRILNLYREIPLPKYMDKMELMGLLQDKLHSKMIRSLYFDEHGEISIKGKFGTYSVHITEKHPQLFVTLQKGKTEKAYQEANYLRCSIAKLFDPAHPENPEEMLHTLTKLRGVPIIKAIAILALAWSIVAPFAVPYSQNDLASKGISNSYLSQYSETITVGDAFDDFFSDPEWENYTVGGQEYVAFTGGCIYLDEPATMTITFRYFGDTFKVDNIAVNGVDIPALLWPGFLETIYSD